MKNIALSAGIFFASLTGHFASAHEICDISTAKAKTEDYVHKSQQENGQEASVISQFQVGDRLTGITTVVFKYDVVENAMKKLYIGWANFDSTCDMTRMTAAMVEQVPTQLSN
jgi:hypothetical protein